MKHFKFFSLVVFILGTRVYDYVSTKQFTPDLEKEINPLASIGGLEWKGITIILLLLMLYVIYALYIRTYKGDQLLPIAKGLSFKEFIPSFYLGHKDNLGAIFWKLPKGATRFHSMIGQILMQALVLAGVLSTTMWLLIKYTNWYSPN